MRSLLIAMRGAVLALTIAVVLLVTPQPAEAATTQLTATENVNVRANPSTSSKIIGGLSRGQTATGISTSNGWTKIKFGSGPGYVYSKYLSKTATLPPSSGVVAGVVKITTTNLNLRKGPGLSYDVIRVLPEGTRVTTTGRASRGFAELVNGSATGWASMQYLASISSGLPAIVGTRVATAVIPSALAASPVLSPSTATSSSSRRSWSGSCCMASYARRRAAAASMRSSTRA